MIRTKVNNSGHGTQMSGKDVMGKEPEAAPPLEKHPLEKETKEAHHMAPPQEKAQAAPQTMRCLYPLQAHVTKQIRFAKVFHEEFIKNNKFFKTKYSLKKVHVDRRAETLDIKGQHTKVWVFLSFMHQWMADRKPPEQGTTGATKGTATPVTKVATNKVNPVFLGSGTFGKAYLVHHRSGKAVMKTSNHAVTKPFANEWGVMNHLNGAGGAPRLLGESLKPAGKVATTLLMEYCGQTTFWQSVRSNKYSHSGFLQILYMVGIQLKEIHLKDTIHNDLKTNNVVLSDDVNPENGLPKKVHIIDFGNALPSGDFPGFKVKGFENYPHLAPELAGEAKCSPVTDTYSFGYMLKTTLQFLNIKHKSFENLSKSAMDTNPETRMSLNDILEEYAHLLTHFALG